MSLDRYAIEVEGVSSQILEFMNGDWAYASDKMKACDKKIFLDPDEAAMNKALVFLAKTPSLQEKQVDSLVKKRDMEGFLQLIIVSASLGLMASRALNLADDLAYTVGKGYRGAARDVASRAMGTDTSFKGAAETIMKRVESKASNSRYY